MNVQLDQGKWQQIKVKQIIEYISYQVEVLNKQFIKIKLILNYKLQYNNQNKEIVLMSFLFYVIYSVNTLIKAHQLHNQYIQKGLILQKQQNVIKMIMKTL
ncbi:hypothetical protein IMG5_075260 [Ichthyophthirius multifiliis]|uniref:Transmembrane protein n=1 Tax=Ichthyophthirius multifiliis TaxID=5932 RepID=G0QQ47_ICHMU|nr:hypothetical protein IMG5_075260 [Ichthyophthirius multifiliis]EGR32661.1 hypothetical protein IMG5_075260 [Ichthyophthirius multifiliis]|eukprot:XP_004036647.1 hypothetical protein IMG5_075260 [Ichthyophthirius multifiliis]